MVQETLPQWVNISLTLLGIVVTGIICALLIKISKSLRDNSTGVILAGLIIVWFIVAYFLAFNGYFQSEEDQRNPLIFIFLLLPIALSFILYKKSKKVQEFIFSIPLSWIIILQVYRIAGGVVFLPLMSMGFLPSVFAIPAGIGDILTGIFAIPAAYMLYKKKRYARPVAIGATIFGIADAVMATTIGFSISVSGVSSTFLAIIPAFYLPLGQVAAMFALIRLKRNAEIIV